ncbi:MAG: helix-turn-helix transcriptional regulator [Opitutales bacterium]
MIGSLIARDESAAVELSTRNCSRLRELGAHIDKYWSHPEPGVLLCQEAALSELSLMLYENLTARQSAHGLKAWSVVEAVLQTYSQELSDNLSQDEIARRVGISPAHLRRMFHSFFKQGPKAVFDQIRYRRILQLLVDTNHSVAEIAELTGFSEASALSRAVKAHFGRSPGSLRTASGRAVAKKSTAP